MRSSTSMHGRTWRWSIIAPVCLLLVGVANLYSFLDIHSVPLLSRLHFDTTSSSRAIRLGSSSSSSLQTAAKLERDPTVPIESTIPDLPDDSWKELPLKPVEKVKVALMTSHFFGDYEGPNKDCKLGDTVIDCVYTSAAGSAAADADALWYHIPSFGGGATKAKPSQLTVGMSMESAEYYGSLNDRSYMSQFDIEMTYRLCSQVPVLYFDYNKHQVGALFTPPKPFEEKKTGLAYVNSNCAAKSGRSDIMKQVIAKATAELPVHSYGRCDNNMNLGHDFDKTELIAGYKFCVAMENSISKDYATEKIWQALEAGCVPVYMGPKNIADFLPDPDAIIDYHKLGSPEALLKELQRLANDKEAYEAKLAWKKRRWEDLSPGFLKMTRISHVHNPHTRCQLCRLVVKNRYKPQKFTTCLFNETWLADSGLPFASGKSL